MDIDSQPMNEPDDGLEYDLGKQTDVRGSVQALTGCRSTLDYVLESLSQALGMGQS